MTNHWSLKCTNTSILHDPESHSQHQIQRTDRGLQIVTCRLENKPCRNDSLDKLSSLRSPSAKILCRKVAEDKMYPTTPRAFDASKTRLYSPSPADQRPNTMQNNAVYKRGSVIPHLHTPLPPIIKLPRELPPLPVIAVLKRTASLPTIPFSFVLPSPNVVLR